MKIVLFALLLSSITAYSSTEKKIDSQVKALLSQMTLVEKIGQLTQRPGEPDGSYKPEIAELVKKGQLGSVLFIRGAKITNELQKLAIEQSRLKIPILFAFDVIAGYRTIFPVPLAQASSWNLELIEQIESVAALEAYSAGIKWTFAPMVDIARDPRWGRIVEGAGEDPYLGSLIAQARVRGFQGNNALGSPGKILACAKHWAGYGAAQAGKDYNTTDLSELELRNIYFPPFKAALNQGVASFMSAFNELNGIPASAHQFLLKDVLRNEWNYKGFVVSDWDSIKEMQNHGFVASSEEAALKAFSAGVDMEMSSVTYQNHLTNLIKQSKIKESQIDNSVRRILKAKFELGLFERPYIDETTEDKILENEKHVALAQRAAAETIVLLKNKNNILPLDKKIKSIAVIGPLAADSDASLGWWRGDRPHLDQAFSGFRGTPAISVLDGIRTKLGKYKNVVYSKGCELLTCTDKSINEAVKKARQAGLAILVLGESTELSGEAASRSRIDLPGEQLQLLKAIYKTKVPVVVVLMNGRPLDLTDVEKNTDAILVTWLNGQQAGNAAAEILFGDTSPKAKLPVTFPRSLGQVPIYYNHKNTGRPFNIEKPLEKYVSKHLDLDNTPLYPFGFGLTYTTFQITDLKLSSQKISSKDKLEAEILIKNTGKRAGTEIVQLYIHRKSGSITRPVRELKGFQSVTLEPGSSKLIKFNLNSEHLGFYGADMKFSVEPGLVDIYVGNSSQASLKTELIIY